MERPRILLTGATGYVGGRLLKALEGRGYRVRCLARRPEFLRAHAGAATEVAQGDVLDANSLAQALAGINIAYYLVHSMGSSGSFEEQDRIAASNFGQAARDAGAQRIIYLGGLGEQGKGLSEHLRSRQEVGEILRKSGVPVIEFRSSVVIGSGSVSFEMVRALVDRLPVMICPKWVRTPTQPIAIEDVIGYLVEAAELPLERGSEIFEIGGADGVLYSELMRAYAAERGLRAWLAPVPLLTPGPSSLGSGAVAAAPGGGAGAAPPAACSHSLAPAASPVSAAILPPCHPLPASSSSAAATPARKPPRPLRALAPTSSS